MTLREILHAHIPMLAPDSTVRDAVDRMDVYQFPALVIVNDLRELQAVVTEGDLARAVSQRGSVAEIGAEPVLPIATRDPFTMPPDTEVSDALHAMLSRGLTFLPVVEFDQVIGVCLRVDLMQAILVDLGSSQGTISS
ncbi:MAG: CBS domain-containing protein [Fimbriimonadaceae bacterium]|nr:CBS domain-containing protein [Fimbriimonadaceae bacterium]